MSTIFLQTDLDILAMVSMVPAYIVCLVVGGGLLVVSTVFGGDHDGLEFDGSVDGGFDLDVDVDSELSGEGLSESTSVESHSESGPLAISNWFSFSFLIYFAAMFGCAGTLLTYLSSVEPGGVLVVSVAMGLIAGQGVHQALRYLRASSGNSAIRREDCVNVQGRVTVAISPPSRGEVVASVRGTQRYLPAVCSRRDDSFSVGEQVVVVGFSNGTAVVVSREEYEFTNES